MHTQTATALGSLRPRIGQGPAMTALILDDNEVDRMRLRKLCRTAGLELEVVEAGSLAEFNIALDDRVFDLVFIDYHLGMETGIEALGRLNAHTDQSQAITIMNTSFNRCDVSVSEIR